MTLDISTRPYFDDYDQDKKFYKILHRPKVAVQARELTQQQTILQNQIKRFGDHIFKNGSMVIPGQIVYDESINYVKVRATDVNDYDVDLDQFLGTKVVGISSGVMAEVVNIASAISSDPDTIFLKFLNSGDDNSSLGFWDGEEVNVDGDAGKNFVVLGDLNLVTPTFLNSGVGCGSSIDAGVYYIGGNFVINDRQSIIIDKYSNVPSVRIGLQMQETIVTSEDDVTLKDNAQGTPNYSAPGADRYKIELILVSYAIDALDAPSTSSPDFIELQRIEDGVIINEIRSAEYAELEKTFARRTYDESGDYTVNPFKLEIKEYYKETDSGDAEFATYKFGKYTSQNIVDMGLAVDLPTAKTFGKERVAVGVEPGKAYVRGFECVKLATTWLPSNKARSIGSISNSVLNYNVGQYVYVSDVFQTPDINIFAQVKLWDAVGATGAGSIPTTEGENTHLIGTAYVKGIELVDKHEDVYTGTITEKDYVYKLYLFNVKLNAGETFNNVAWISNSSSAAQFTCSTDVVGEGINITYAQYNNEIVLIDVTKKQLVFSLPHNYIKTVYGTTYTVSRKYSSVVGSIGQLMLTANAGEVFDSSNGNNYIVTLTTGADTEAAFMTGLTVVPDGVNLTITGGAIIAGGIYDIICPVIKMNPVQRSKSLVTSHQFNVVPSALVQGITYLDRADGSRLIAVYQSASMGTPAVITDPEVTTKFDFNNGQEDSIYNLSSIILKSGESPPTGQLLVVYDYFSHGAGDYFSVDSYASIPYTDIPSVNTENGLIFLSDAIDFRPVMDSTGIAFDGTGGTIGELPVVNSNVRCDYDHYLGRTDKLYMDFSGRFNITEGISDVNPIPPKSPEDGMVIYHINMDAYTLDTTCVRPKYMDNKRFTMEMIGSLEKRIGTLEYYNSLSLLEKETAQLKITDAAGLDRFKNGFIVEPFSSHGIGDCGSPEYRCSISPELGIMRPTFASDSVDLLFNESASANVQKTGSLITLPYTSVPFISQQKATEHENVNPFAVRTFEGQVIFNPDSDNWYDTQKVGQLIVNNDANFEALEFIAKNGKGLDGVQWNDWETSWSSTSAKKVTSETVSRRASGISHGAGWLQTTTTAKTTTTTASKRTGVDVNHYTTRINTNMGDRTVGINYIPYMRAINILVKVTKLKPTTRLYSFFDEIAVSQYCIPLRKITIGSRNVISLKTVLFKCNNYAEETITIKRLGATVATAKVVFDNGTDTIQIVNLTANILVGDVIYGASAIATITALETARVLGDPIVTDSVGQVAMMFSIPNNNDHKFRTGERVFLLTDQINNS